MALPPSPKKKSKFRRRLPERKTVNGMDISSGSLNVGSVFGPVGGAGGLAGVGGGGGGGGEDTTHPGGVAKPGASYIQLKQFVLGTWGGVVVGVWGRGGFDLTTSQQRPTVATDHDRVRGPHHRDIVVVCVGPATVLASKRTPLPPTQPRPRVLANPLTPSPPDPTQPP